MTTDIHRVSCLLTMDDFAITEAVVDGENISQGLKRTAKVDNTVE